MFSLYSVNMRKSVLFRHNHLVLSLVLVFLFALFVKKTAFSIIFGSGLFVCSLCKETASSCLQVSPQVLATLGDPKAFNKF